MAGGLILNIGAKLGLENHQKVKKELSDLAGNFRKTFGSAIDKAFAAGFDKKDLTRWESEATRIQGNLAKARTRAERESILAQEKGFQKEFANIRLVSDRRIQAMKQVGHLASTALLDATDDFARGLDSAISSTLQGNLQGIGETIKGMGSKMQGWGMAAQAKESKGPMGTMVKLMGKLVKSVGVLSMKMGMAAGITGLLIAGIIKVVNHGQKMNRTLLSGGAVAGDFADQGENLRKTLSGVRKSFQDIDRNLEWMQTGEEQLAILGAWNAAGQTVKEMNEGLAEGEHNVQMYRKAVETATSYSRLLGMEASEVAESMSGYMEELGYSLDGIREKFAQVYDVAQQSGFGTKRFFGMVQQAASGMQMYNVRLVETANLLAGMSKILGASAAQETVRDAAGSGPTTRKEAIVQQKKEGRRVSRKLAQTTGERWGRELIEKFDQAGLSKEKLAEELASRGFKIDTSSAQGMINGIGKLSEKDRVKLVSALGDIEKVTPELVTQVQRSFSALRAAYTKSPKDIAAAMTDRSINEKLVAQLHGLKGIMSADINDMSEKQIIAFQELNGFNEAQTKNLIMMFRSSKSHYADLMKAMKSNEELNKESYEDQMAARKEQIKKYGAYVSEQGDLISASDPAVLELTGLEKEQYEKENKIGKSLLDYQSRRMDQVVKGEEKVDAQLEAARDIGYATEDVTKAIDIMAEGVMSEILDVIESIYYWIVGSQEKTRKAALQQAQEEKRKAAFVVRSEKKALAKAQREHKKKATPESQKALEEAEDLVHVAEMRASAAKKTIGKVRDMQKAEISSVTGTLDMARQRAGAGALPLDVKRKWKKEAEEEAARRRKTGKFDRWKTERQEATSIYKERVAREMRDPEKLMKKLRSEMVETRRFAIHDTGQMEAAKYAFGRGQKVLRRPEERAGRLVGSVADVAGMSKKQRGQLADVYAGKSSMTQGLQKMFTPEVIATLKEAGLSKEAQEKFGLGGGLSGDKLQDLINMTEEQRNIAIAEMKAEEADKPREKQFMTNLLANVLPEKFAEVIERAADKAQKAELTGELAATGIQMNTAKTIAAKLMTGGTLTEAEEALLKAKEGQLGGSRIAKGYLEQMDDFIWRPGQAPVRINEGDVLTGAKAGGPLARGGAGGGVVNVHMYGNVDGYRANRAKIARVMEGRT
jgi:hypothetical protein